MTRYLLSFERDPRAAEWLEDRLDRPLTPGVLTAALRNRKGDLVGVAGFEFWTENSVGIHVAADQPVALRSARGVLSVALEHVPRVWALVRRGHPSHRLALRLGFMETGLVPEGYAPGVDLVLLTLTRESFHVR